MSRSKKEATPLAQNHIATLIQTLPEHMLAETITKSQKTRWHLRPTILADFLREESGLRTCKATVGLRASVTDSHFIISVRGYALTKLCQMELPVDTGGSEIGRYEFVHTEELPTLQAKIPHGIFKKMLCEVYGVPITYSLDMVKSLAEHLTIGKTAMDRSTKIRVQKARESARKNK